MAYEPIDWKNGAEGGTPTSAANFNHMDGGIARAHEALQSKANTSDIPDVSNFISAADIPEIPEVPAPQFTDDEVQALKALIEGE